MSTEVHAPRLTLDDFLRLPDDGLHHELQAGFLLSEPLPMRPHGRTQGRLLRLLAEFVESKKLGEVFGETGYLLATDPDTVRGPDVSFVSADRLRSASDESKFFPGAPDLAVEIVSPSNRAGELHGKVADYLAAGSRMVWVVDPATQTVMTYRTLLQPRRLTVSDSLEGEDVLPGLDIEVRGIFRVED